MVKHTWDIFTLDTSLYTIYRPKLNNMNFKCKKTHRNTVGYPQRHCFHHRNPSVSYFFSCFSRRFDIIRTVFEFSSIFAYISLRLACYLNSVFCPFSLIRLSAADSIWLFSRKEIRLLGRQNDKSAYSIHGCRDEKCIVHICVWKPRQFSIFPQFFFRILRKFVSGWIFIGYCTITILESRCYDFVVLLFANIYKSSILSRMLLSICTPVESLALDCCGPCWWNGLFGDGNTILLLFWCSEKICAHSI